MLLGKTGTISVRCQRSFISGSGVVGGIKVIIMGCNFSQDCTIVTYITIREWDNCEQWKLKCFMGSEEENKIEEQVDTTAAPINCTHWFWWYRTSPPTGSPVFSPTFLWLGVFWIPSHYYKQTRFRKSFCDRHKSKGSELFVLLASLDKFTIKQLSLECFAIALMSLWSCKSVAPPVCWIYRPESALD